MASLTLSKATDQDLLDEINRRFSSWLFYGRARSDESEPRIGTYIIWRGDAEVCLGGASYLVHHISVGLDEQLLGDDAPEQDAGYL